MATSSSFVHVRPHPLALVHFKPAAKPAAGAASGQVKLHDVGPLDLPPGVTSATTASFGFGEHVAVEGYLQPGRRTQALLRDPPHYCAEAHAAAVALALQDSGLALSASYDVFSAGQVVRVRAGRGAAAVPAAAVHRQPLPRLLAVLSSAHSAVRSSSPSAAVAASAHSQEPAMGFFGGSATAATYHFDGQ